MRDLAQQHADTKADPDVQQTTAARRAISGEVVIKLGGLRFVCWIRTGHVPIPSPVSHGTMRMVWAAILKRIAIQCGEICPNFFPSY